MALVAPVAPAALLMTGLLVLKLKLVVCSRQAGGRKSLVRLLLLVLVLELLLL